MEAANARWFDENDTLADASGICLRNAIETRYGMAEVRAEGGIRNPVRRELNDIVIVRFDGSSRPSLAVAGKWWLEWSQYLRIETIARAASVDINTVFRELCYVPLEWNNLHVVVQARVLRPLLAYEGPGVPVASISPTLSVSNLIGNNPIAQLYIPGLANDACRHALAIEGQGFQPGTSVDG